jgi:hypothetical protein
VHCKLPTSDDAAAHDRQIFFTLLVSPQQSTSDNLDHGVEERRNKHFKKRRTPKVLAHRKMLEQGKLSRLAQQTEKQTTALFSRPGITDLRQDFKGAIAEADHPTILGKPNKTVPALAEARP